jgi:hypothetical protein
MLESSAEVQQDLLWRLTWAGGRKLWVLDLELFPRPHVGGSPGSVIHAHGDYILYRFLARLQ